MKFDFESAFSEEPSLDPKNWADMKKVALQMVEDMFDLLQNINSKKVWEVIPEKVKNSIDIPVPRNENDVTNVYQDFKEQILPYYKGNIHPRYWSWVEGTGTSTTMMAEMLAAGLNSNCNNGEHIAMYIETMVMRWLKQALALPDERDGSLVSGGSMANLSCLLVARNYFTKNQDRATGVGENKYRIYVTSETHSCIAKAAEIMGIGSKSIRRVNTLPNYSMNVAELQDAIDQDRKKGYTPFCVVANIGTVRTGAVDPIKEISGVCKRESLWLHIDGAYGIFAKLLPEYNEMLQHVNNADSIAFDLHKWMYIPYEAGCFFVKNKQLLTDTFSLPTDYLSLHEKGLASGPEPMSNLSIEMSRGFKALKIWMMIKEHGMDKISKSIKQNIIQAHYLAHLIEEESNLELLSEVLLNVVCFRYRPNKDLQNDILNKLNKDIVMQLHCRGIAAPSYTILNDVYAIRVANVNHRSRKRDFDILIKSVIEIGNELTI